MTDRELLEFAAKAAGVEVWFPRMSGGRGLDGKRIILTPCHTKDSNGVVIEWNPLVDDGDALRLAVKLNLSVCVELDQTWIAAKGYPTTPLCFVNHDGDSYAATRRAIVKVAAEIGFDKTIDQ